jgi:aryl-alcohol dehydrogenase-like predicted oxidoreductase
MKLALGTVQFGLDYGITNSDGQVSNSEVEKILDFSLKNGINVLDTASSYGNSEKVLGKIGVNDYQIITKTIPLKNDVNEVIDGFYKSLENLNKDQIEGLLVHNINDIENKQFDVLFNKLSKLKKEGLVKKIGFSTYTPEHVDLLLDNFEFDLIQLPFNIFDVRLIEGGQLQALKNKGVEIHARSVFLQGVLLDFDNLSDYFLSWKKQFNKYQIMVENSGFSLLEYALNFALNIQEIDKVLVGVNTEKQLREIVGSVKGQEQISFNADPIYDINLLNPSLWKL